MYVVPGNGSCGPNCASALLFGDEVFGPKLRRSMNHHMAKHWNIRYKDITQCSPGHPFVRKLGDGEVSFTDPEDLLEFLTKSQDAELMWTDSEDLAVISDMYQMKIKIITSKGLEDSNPNVNWIYPEKTMEGFAELKDVQIGEMVLYHEDDCHFNLIVSKNSDLALMGSLSYRFNIGPMVADDDEDTDGIAEEKAEEDDSDVAGNQNIDVRIKNLQKELKKSQENQNKISSEYIKCEKELRNKTEEVEILKVEVKDLNEIIRLRDEIHENDSNDKPKAKTKTKTNNDEQAKRANVKNLNANFGSNRFEKKTSSQREGFSTLLNCNKCDFLTKTESLLTKHFELVHSTEGQQTEFNCHDCDYQGTSKTMLNRHVFLKHTVQEQFKCNTCGKQFSDKANLLNHRKNHHTEAVAICRKFLEGICHFTSKMCWWNHRENGAGNIPDIICYICSERFESKMELMIHRKNKHREVVRGCTNFAKNSCMFQEQSCWFIHEEEAMDTADPTEEEEEVIGSEDEAETPSVFQRVFRSTKPPLGKMKQNQKSN